MWPSSLSVSPLFCLSRSHSNMVRRVQLVFLDDSRDWYRYRPCPGFLARVLRARLILLTLTFQLFHDHHPDPLAPLWFSTYHNCSATEVAEYALLRVSAGFGTLSC